MTQVIHDLKEQQAHQAAVLAALEGQVGQAGDTLNPLQQVAVPVPRKGGGGSMFGGANPLLMSSAGAAAGAASGAVGGGDRPFSVRDGTASLCAQSIHIFEYLRLLFSPSFPFINSILDIPRGGGVAAGMRVNNPLMQSQRFQRGVVPSSPAASGAGEGEFSDAHGPDDSA